MIDPLAEELISPSAAAGLYPRGPEGKKVHVSKVYRDMKRGHRGISLESVRTPKLATSRQAVARYFRRLDDAMRPTTPARPTSTGRAAGSVDRELDRLGF